MSSSGRVAGALALISDQVLAGTSADVQFPTIPQGYRHLELVVDARGDTAAVTTPVKVEFNADTTATNYNSEYLQAHAALTAGAVLNSQLVLTVPAASATASHSGSHRLEIPNYAGTTFFKRALCQSHYFNNTDYFAESNGLTWRNAAAITQIDLKPNAGNFIIGSRFTLYGLN